MGSGVEISWPILRGVIVVAYLGYAAFQTAYVVPNQSSIPPCLLLHLSIFFSRV